MFIPTTPRTKQALRFTRQEANDWNHAYLGCEHLLLGMLRVDDCIAATVLKKCGIELKDVRKTMAELVYPGPKRGKLHFRQIKTPRLKHVLRQVSKQESKQLGHKYIGTEHLLLALLHEPENLALMILQHLGIESDAITHTVYSYV